MEGKVLESFTGDLMFPVHKFSVPTFKTAFPNGKNALIVSLEMLFVGLIPIRMVIVMSSSVTHAHS